MERLLAVEPESKKYKGDQAVELEADLKALDQHSVFYPVHSANEVLLDDEGRTAGGNYRLTTKAFYQICQETGCGLYRLVADLSGRDRRPEEARSDFSFPEALGIYNSVVRRRFGTRLAGCQLLRNTHKGLIAGLVGPRYRRLPNAVFYTQVQEVLGRMGERLPLYEAVLNGWWLLVRFYSPRNLFELTGPIGERDRYFAGYHFSNDEVGEGAVKAAALVLRNTGRTAALTPVPGGGYIRHQGQDFNARLGRVLSGVRDRLNVPEHYLSRVETLKEQKLLLGTSEKADERRVADLARQLNRRGVPVALGKRIVQAAWRQGSYDAREMPICTRGDRTVYDLFNALGRVARGLPISMREQAERLAYALLSGRLAIN